MSKKTAKKPVAADDVSAVLSHKAIPTYPLSPSEIEVIVHTRWDGNAFGASERAGDACIALEGEELKTFMIGLPFNSAYKPLESRTVEIAAANDADANWLMDRAHRVQLVSVDGKVPASLAGTAWKPGKPGVKKPDGIGILLVRPQV